MKIHFERLETTIRYSELKIYDDVNGWCCNYMSAVTHRRHELRCTPQTVLLAAAGVCNLHMSRTHMQTVQNYSL
jgi:hypothetical protein